MAQTIESILSHYAGLLVVQGSGSARCQAGHQGWELVGSCRLHALVLNLQPTAPTYDTGF